MTKITRRLALALLATTTLAATASFGQEDRNGGELTIGTVGDPKNWDHQNGQGANLVIIQRNVFDSLVFQNLEGAFEPWLASSWDISEDGKSYTFHLRQDVTFSNGEKFNADAVKLNFDRLTSKETASRSYAGNFPYAGSTVVDEYTVRIDLQQPQAAFLQVVSSPGAAILAPASAALTVAELGEGGSKAIGTGPYVYSEYLPDQRITLTKNPNYNWAPASFKHQGQAYLDKLTFVFLPETSVRVGALGSGQIDVALNIAPADYLALQADSRFQLLQKYNAGTADLLLLNTSKGVLADVNVRKALLRGVDVRGLVDVVYRGTHGHAWSVLTPDTRYYDPSLEDSWPLDVDLANKLLDEAGWTGRDAEGYRTKDGARLSATWLVNGDATTDLVAILGEGVQADAKKLGFEIKRDIVDAGTFAKRGAANEYDLVQQGTNRAEADILRSNLFGSHALPETRLQNYARVQEPELDKLLDAASFSVDDDLRRENYVKVQHWVLDNAYAVPLVVRAWLGAASVKVNDITYDVVGFPESYYDTWLQR